jgi:hypothetical protein
MAVSWTITKSVTGGALSASENRTVSDETQTLASPTVPVALTSVLTVRTDDTSGSLTMDAGGHGITTGSRVDLYWDGGRCYGATVGTVATNVIPITDVAGGDVLPAQATAIKVGKCVEAPFGLVGANISGLVGTSLVEGYIVAADAGADVAVFELEAGKVSIWEPTDAAANPLAGDTPTKAFFSHSDVNTAQTEMKLAALHH